MNLQSITAKVKPRLGWEALDLGFRMVQHHWRDLYSLWFGITLPFFILGVLLFHNHLLWFLVAFWWIKPLFDTSLLNYISQALFDQRPGFKQSIQQFPSYAFKQWFAALTWRRFSLTRPMDLAVSQLENLSGNSRSRRLGTLHAFNAGACSWLTLLFLFFHLLFYVNLLLLVVWLTPDIYLQQLGDDVIDWLWSSESISGQIIQATLIYLLLGFFSPFHMLGGFSIYINQRTILEAWDIELVFRQLAQRINKQQHKTRRKNRVQLLCVPVLCLMMITLSESQAVISENQSVTPENQTAISENQPVTSEKKEEKQEQQATLTKQQAKQQINDILDNEPFRRHQQQSRVTFDFNWDWNSNDQKQESSDFNFLSFFNSLATIAELLLWLVVIFIVFWLIVKLTDLKHFFRFGKKKTIKQNQPDLLFGLDMRADSLPEHPEKNSWQLWQKGQHRQALSLLLKATIVQLIEHCHCDFEAGDTELECAALVRRRAPKNCSAYFDELIQIWRLYAYGHQLPKPEKVEHLCNSWPRLFSDSRFNQTVSIESSVASNKPGAAT